LRRHPAARDVLVDRAAARLNVARGTLAVKDGRVVSSGAAVSFGDLVKGAPLLASISDKATTKPPSTWTIAGFPQLVCTAPAVADALTRQGMYDEIVNALSMRNFIPSADQPSGHDQFFSTFGKFGEATWRVTSLSIVDPESLAPSGADPVAVLLASEASRHITGQAIAVDGGATVI